MNFTKRLLISMISLSSAASYALTANDIVRNDQGAGVRIKNIIQPSFVNSHRVEFNLGEISLKKDESVYMTIPSTLASKHVDFVSVTHHQDPNDERECVPEKPKWDCLPGYTSLEIYDQNKKPNQAWRYWNGLGSGPYNSKFAEVSEYGEVDNLYEWFGHGSISVNDGSMDNQGISPLLVRVRSLGPDSVIAQNVVIKFLPERPSKLDDFIFSRGFVFGDWASARGRIYPGNSEIGDYGNSMVLNYSSAQHPMIPNNWSSSVNGLRIPLKSGMRLSFVDVAGGDMRRMPPSAKQDDYRGTAALSMSIVRENRVDTIMDNENVGMSGVMRAPYDSDEEIHEGDFLLIQSTSVMQVMGIRIGYAN